MNEEALKKKCRLCAPAKLGLVGIGYTKLFFNILAILYLVYILSVIKLHVLGYLEILKLTSVGTLLLFDTAFTAFFTTTDHQSLSIFLDPTSKYRGVTWLVPTLAAAVTFSHTEKTALVRPWAHPSYRILLALDAITGIGIESSLAIMLQVYVLVKARNEVMKLRNRLKTECTNNMDDYSHKSELQVVQICPMREKMPLCS